MARKEQPKPVPNVVQFDKDRKQNFHLNDLGERVYHEKPAGYEFDAAGTLQEVSDGSSR